MNACAELRSGSALIAGHAGDDFPSAGLWTAYLVNLDRRPDRLHRTLWLLRDEPWLLAVLRRMRAVEGASLELRKLAPSVIGERHSEARPGQERRFGPLMGTGLTLNHDWLHMTPGAVGCALSHRAIWEDLLTTRSGDAWALVLEDDLCHVVGDLRRRLAAVLDALPVGGWDVCYLGWHGQHVNTLALDSFRRRAAGHEQGQLRLVEWSVGASMGPLGTFAYLVSAAGARRLLGTGAKDGIFPLDFQLDKQLNQAYAERKLRAYMCSDDQCLFYSPSCQLADSDVQTVWAADHHSDMRHLKEAFSQWLRDIDFAAACAPAPAPLPVVDGPHGALRATLDEATLRSSRRCALLVAASPKDLDACAAIAGGLGQALRGDGRLPIVLLTYGEECEALPLPPSLASDEACARLHLGQLSAALDAEYPCASLLGASPLAGVLPALRPLLAIEVDEVIVIATRSLAGTSPASMTVGPTVRALLEQTAGGQIGGDAAIPRPAELLARPAAEGDGAELQRALIGSLTDATSCPTRGFVAPDDVKAVAHFDPAIFMLAGQARFELATWLRELLRSALWFFMDGWDPGIAVVAALRCVIGLADIRLRLVAEVAHAWTPDDFEAVD